MPRTTTSKVTEILNCSISLEHGAIIQYLTHAYLLGESGIGAEIINIARTEMRHLKYFGDLLVDLGGEPDLFKRGPMFSDANSAFAMISNGITAETEAIKAYEAFCDELDHAPAQRIFTRVLTDERFHLAQFGSFLAPATELLATYPAVPAADTAAPAHAIALLNGAVSQEYRAILLHVYEHLKSRDFWLREHTLEAMNWAMKHVGFLADRISERQGTVSLGELPDSSGAKGRLSALREAVALEETLVATYTRLAEELLEPAWQALLVNLRSHQLYQTEELHDGLARVAGSMKPTVGSLLADGSAGLPGDNSK